MDQATDLVSAYCDTLLKKIVAKVQASKKKKIAAERRSMETAETATGVRTMRHWRASSDSEFYYKEMQKGFQEMKDLDSITAWSEKLHQDRFKFMHDKYADVLSEYERSVKEYVS